MVYSAILLCAIRFYVGFRRDNRRTGIKMLPGLLDL
jgi:hypothetical protein